MPSYGWKQFLFFFLVFDSRLLQVKWSSQMNDYSNLVKRSQKSKSNNNAYFPQRLYISMNRLNTINCKDYQSIVLKDRCLWMDQTRSLNLKLINIEQSEDVSAEALAIFQLQISGRKWGQNSRSSSHSSKNWNSLGRVGLLLSRSKSTAKLQLSFVIVSIVQCCTFGIATAFPNKIDKTNQSDEY